MIISGRRAQLEGKAATILAQTISRMAVEQQEVSLGVVGGTSVGSILELLAAEPVDWSKVHLFMLDERAVPISDPGSNFKLVSETMRGSIADDHMHPFIHKPHLPCGGATDYQALFGEHGGRFDIILLSSGDDGHVASLFPNHKTIRSTSESFIMTSDAPKPPPIRVSASRQMIEAAREAVLLFFGEQKQQAYSMFMADQLSIEQCPARIVRNIPSHYILNDQEGRYDS